MDKVLNVLIGTVCEVYFDDIMIFASSEKAHDIDVKLVLKRLQHARLKINCKSLQYKQQAIKLLGVTVNESTNSLFKHK